MDGGAPGGTAQGPQPEGLGAPHHRLPAMFNDAFKRMRVHTAAGLDNMAAPFIKLAVVGSGAEAEHILKGRLCTWLTGMLGRGGMPTAWQPVRIQPIYKKGDPLDPGNYRPIAMSRLLTETVVVAPASVVLIQIVLGEQAVCMIAIAWTMPDLPCTNTSAHAQSTSGGVDVGRA